MDASTEAVARARIVANHPSFLALAQSRARVRWGLSALTVTVFFGFVLMIGFGAGSFATKVGDGLMPLGFYLAIGMILFVVAVTGLYARLGARLYGQMTDVVVKELGL
jgi:uncharacterized membrane protein (DUF485 family)